jgi:hypothetical protein
MADSPPKKNLHSRPVTEARLEELLAEQADVILTAVGEKMDTNQWQVIGKLDAIMGEVQKHREEDVTGVEQLRRHEDQLQDHAVRIKKLEVVRNP